MKDYLESENFVIEQVTPRAVMRKAFEANLLADGQDVDERAGCA